MDADVLNEHLADATAAVWAVEGQLVDELEQLLRAVAKEAASNFERKVVRFGVQAAAVDVDVASTMIAVYPHSDEAAALAQPDGQKAETLHCTLAFLGDTTEAEFATLADAVQAAVAAQGSPLSGAVGGVACFAKGPDGHPSILLPDVPGLAELRHHVAEAAAQAGFDPSGAHHMSNYAQNDTGRTSREAARTSGADGRMSDFERDSVEAVRDGEVRWEADGSTPNRVAASLRSPGRNGHSPSVREQALPEREAHGANDEPRSWQAPLTATRDVLDPQDAVRAAEQAGLGSLSSVRSGSFEALSTAAQIAHGWVPHITIAYTDTAQPPPESLLELPLTFDRVSIVRGDILRRDVLLDGAEMITAAAPQGMSDIAAAWAAPTKDEVLGAQALSGKVSKAVNGAASAGLDGFAGAMPTCIPKYAKGGSLPAHVDRSELATLFKKLDVAKAEGTGYRKHLDAIRKTTGMSPTAARKALEAERKGGVAAKATPIPKAREITVSRTERAPLVAKPVPAATKAALADEAKAKAYWKKSGGSSMTAAQKAKRDVQASLHERLSGNPIWTDYLDRNPLKDEWGQFISEKKSSPEAVRRLIDNWAKTSADSDPLAHALQRAAAEEFRLADNSLKFNGLANRAAYEKLYAQNGAVYRLFVRTMYEYTQEQLKLAGFKDTVTLYRGMEVPARKFGSVTAVKDITLQPMSSFTSNVNVTDIFGDRVFATQVPIERILSVPFTGFGCLREFEWVVLGTRIAAVADKAYMTRTVYGGSATAKSFASQFWSRLASELGESMRRSDDYALTAAGDDEFVPVDEDGDWIKRGVWDLLDVSSGDELCAYLQRTDTTPESFRNLDIYKANVNRLEWLQKWTGCDEPVTAALSPCDGVEVRWDVTSRFYGQALARTGEHIVGISENVRSDVMGVIEKAYTEGASVADTARMIEDVMGGEARGWAETIARTELNSLANRASLDAVDIVSQASGVSYLKEWLTAPGAAHPRHELDEGLDGQMVALDEFFEVGGTQLEYPGDPNGDPGETINCRCTLVYHDSGGDSTPAGNDNADLAGGAAVTSSPVTTRYRPGGQIRSDSALRRAVRQSLTAAAISPTYPLTHGGLAELRFYEAVEEAGYAEIDSAWWPTESRALDTHSQSAIFRDGEGCAVYRFGNGQIVHACIGHDSISVKVASADREAGAEMLATFRAAYPASFVRTEGDSRVPITFWSMGAFGPSPRLRRIEASSWEGIERNYTAAVREQLDALMAWQHPSSEGQLILWQGAPGTGKTWALRALASEWSRWAEFHYITDPDSFFVDHPSYMVDVLLSDSYSVIDSEGSVYEETAAEGKWRVLILEDTGELLSATAKEKYGQGLSRLLNVVDGMIGQGLRVLVLVTTNDELGELNPAVKRPGRCASQIVFTPLDPSETAAWLGSDVEEGLTVAELYERTKTGEEALEATDGSMPCANCEHTYDDHSGACSIDGCDCKSFAKEGAEAAILNSGTSTTVNLPDGASSITLSFDNATAPITVAGEVPVVDVQPEAAAPTDASMVRWSAVLAPEGRATDDGRIFAPGSITWRELPLTLMALVETGEGGHQGAEIVGRIDRIWRDEATTPILIRAEGVFDSSEFGQEVARLVGNKILRGNSVDLAVREYLVGNRADYIDEGGNWIGDNAPEADILDVLFGGEDLIMVVTDGVIGMSTVCPFPAFEDGEISLAAAGIQFFVAADPTNLRWNIRTEDSFTLCEGLTASAAGLVPVTPPREWFDVPEPDELTPLTVDEEGRVFGHAWTWNECHIGIPNKCTVAPHTQTDYAHFLLKEVEVALDDAGDVTERIHCGTITLGTGHAGRGLGANEASEHYDNTGAAVADVVIVDGEHGGWICGALRPDTPAEKVRELRGAVLSGDWRSIGGNLELVGLLAVNVPGFPVPRTKALVTASASGEESDVVTLIAAGKVLSVDNPTLDEGTRALLRAWSARASGGFDGLAKLAQKP